jgi:hypothetical protein
VTRLPESDFGGHDAAEMMGWIEAIAAHGPRRPGSDADLAVEGQLAGMLGGFGFESVRREPIPIAAWDEGGASLVVEHDGFASEAFPIPHAAPTLEGGIAGPLLFVDPDRLPARDRWRGAIVVAEIRFPRLETRLLLRIAPGQHDPDGTLPLVDHPATWVRLGWHLYREAVRRGAAGFVGILTDQPGGTCRMYAPYGFREADILDKPLPGVWIGRDDGTRLKERVSRQPTRARLTVAGGRREMVTHNVVAELPGRGKDDEVIVLSCHHDSPFASPVEDASGCAVVLALARKFASERPLRRRLVVLFTAGHFHGSIGTRRFIHAHPDLVKRAAVEITIEHIAREAIEGPDGGLIPTGRPEATAMFVSFSRAISDAVLDGVAEQGVDRVVLLPAEGPLGSYPPTDGGDWFEAGVPVVNCISNPVCLLTADDEASWVDRERLPRMAAAFEQIIRRLDAEDRRTLARTSSWPYRLAMKGLRIAAWAKATRFGTRPIY